MLQKLFKQYMIEISFLLFMIGVFFLIISVFSVFLFDSVPRGLLPLIEPINETRYDYWLILIGPAMTGLGYYYLNQNRKYKKEFNKLIDTESKATFIKSQDRIEYLAWNLGGDYRQVLYRKKKEFKIK